MIYLDNNATTALHPAVREAMLPWLTDSFGNPSAGYRLAKESRRAIDRAREQVAALIDCEPGEIVFTSGGTESINTALMSALRCYPERKGLLLSAVEHSAVFESCSFFGSTGYDVRLNPVDSGGRIDLAAWRTALKPGETVLASLVWANNETGTISPVAEAAEAAREAGVLFHTDAVQAAGKIPLSIRDTGIDLLSLSGHKFHGPKGVGALFVSRRIRFQPLLFGGGQEDRRRSGTENVAGIVGMGQAAELAREALADGLGETLRAQRDRFETGAIEKIPEVEVNGHRENRLPNTSNLHFPGVDGEGLLILLDQAGVCCSPGSACSTGAVKPSRVLQAMGQTSRRARSSVRFSLSRFTTADEIDRAIAAVADAAGKLRLVLPTGGSRVSFHS